MIADDYKALLLSFNQAFDRLELELTNIRAQEKIVSPNSFREHYQREQVLGKSFNLFSQRKEAAQHVFGELIRFAESQFAPAGTRLKIDSTDVDDHFHLRENDYSNFDPVAVWAYLESEFKSQGEDIAYAQAADPIARKFDITPNQVIKTVGGQIVLEYRVWIDSFDKKHSNVNNLSQGCIEGLRQLCNGLAAFAVWAEDPLLAHALNQFASNFGYRNSSIQSRARYPLGHAKQPEITVITYTTRFEFRFSPSIGLKLQEFLALYATRLQEAA